MIRRCTDKKSNRYYVYGAKGIKVCERWMTLNNFLEDMLPTYKKGLTIDRIDNNKGYEPSNCRWATMKEQQNNRTNNRWFEFRGMKKTMAQWAEYMGINKTTLDMRINTYNWDIIDALTRPVQKGRVTT